MSEAADMIAEAFSALADEGSGHGVPLYREGWENPVIGVVSPIPPESFEGRISQEVATAVIVSVDRSEFGGDYPLVGQSFRDRDHSIAYRILTAEDLPQRPHIVYTCEASPFHL